MTISKWYRAWKGEKNYLPQSHGRAMTEIREVFAPIMAQISIISGDSAGDLSALLKATSTGEKICDSCSNRISTISLDGNYGHQDSCEMLKQAREVMLSDRRDRQRRELEDEQQQLKQKLELNQSRLDSLAARRGAGDD